MASRVDNQAVVSSAFRPFPRLTNGKIKTYDFLEASRGIVEILDKLGKLFAPFSSDISCNVEKVNNFYLKDPENYLYLENLIISEKLANNDLLIDAVLWLNRALHFISIFFHNILCDSKKSECLQKHISLAYSQALEPYHSWITRQIFKVLKNVIPKRTELLSSIFNACESIERDNEKYLQIYLEGVKENVYHIKSLYKEYNLDCNNKV